MHTVFLLEPIDMWTNLQWWFKSSGARQSKSGVNWSKTCLWTTTLESGLTRHNWWRNMLTLFARVPLWTSTSRYKIRRFLSYQLILIHAFVTFRLDYCNSLLSVCLKTLFKNFNMYRTLLPVYCDSHSLRRLNILLWYFGCLLLSEFHLL